MVGKKRNIKFALTFPENEKKDANSFVSQKFTFDGLADFVEEREKIKRLLEKRNETELRIDYSDFSNHVFFDSAVAKYGIAKDRILTKYPFNGSREDKDNFFLSSSGYDSYVFDTWPRHVGYLELSGAQYVSASDTDNKLLINSSSLYISSWINPVIEDENIVLQKIYKNNNKLSYSEDFDHPFWTKTRCFISASSIAGPFSGTLGSTVVEDVDVATTRWLTKSSRPTQVSGTYEWTTFAKAANRTWIQVFLNGAGSPSNGDSHFFDLESGVIGSSAGTVDPIMESYGNGWYRVGVKFSAIATSTVNINLIVSEADLDGTFNGLGQDSLYVWGAEFKENTHIDLATYPAAYAYTSGSIFNTKDGYQLLLSGATDPHAKFTIFSGNSETTVSSSYTEFTGSFNNVAAIYDTNLDLLSLYVNKDRKVSSSVAYGPFRSPVTKFYVGSGSKTDNSFLSGGFDLYSGSIDEVRVMLTSSELLHQKVYSKPIDAEDYVKLNYTFNEGATETGSIDQIVVDYSKNGLHGIIQGHAANVRVSGSTMNIDPGDPILYSFHSRVKDYDTEALFSSSLHDQENNNNIFNMIPENILIEDENAEGLLESFTLAMARYFDDIKSYIDQFDNLKVTNYESVNETPDLFLPFVKEYFGWKVAEHFGDADPLSFFFGEGVLTSGTLDVPLVDIKNSFWRRTLNNLPYLMKTKGKRHNLDAFFNVLGVNRENINIKEYGYLPGGSIQDDRIEQERVVSLLGIGTGSSGLTTGSYIETPSSFSFNETSDDFSVETMVQLPFASSSYTNTINTGSLWTLTGTLGFVTLYWVRADLEAEVGKFVLSSSFPSSFSSSDVSVFDGNVVHITAGRNTSDIPFISVRGIEGCDITLSQDFTGSAAFSLSGNDTYRFVMGAQSASLDLTTQGFFGEYRIWSRELSGSELDDHALDFLSVGTKDPLEVPNPLLAHWSLNEDVVSNSNGDISNVLDLSRNGLTATGSNFPASENAYQKFLKPVNPLSPSIDLKWTENKVRIRNKTELTIDDVASDTNEVSLEFNLVDALNRDISKIFSSFDQFNELIGNPVNKYRDEYADLEGVRRVYFERLGDSVNFTSFFELFKWFDKKLSDAIKQLLPSRVKFIGGEQVIESHFLERSKYGYKYPVFRTPRPIPEIGIDTSTVISGSKMATFSTELNPASISSSIMPRFVSTYSDGDDRVDRNSEHFYRTKYSGDQRYSINNPNTALNSKNEWAKRSLQDQERDNDVVDNGGLIVNAKLGNGFRFKDMQSVLDQEHYFTGYKKHIPLVIRGLSGSDLDAGAEFTLSGSELELSMSLYDATNIKIDTGSFMDRVFGIPASGSVKIFDPLLTFQVSASNVAFDSTQILTEFKDDNSDLWISYANFLDYGSFFDQKNGWYKFEAKMPDVKVPFDHTIALWKISASLGQSLVFKDIKLEFLQELVNSGVKEFRAIDNQNIEFSVFNRDVLKGIED